MSKIILFEYFLKKLVEWYCDFYSIRTEAFNTHSLNNLSKLKVIKLHFFTCSTSEDALAFFNDFHAMPYGHVESEVYNKIGHLQFCSVSNTGLFIKEMQSFNDLTCQNHAIIDNAIQLLKNTNYSLISFAPFELVELSHKWFSWRYNFQKAKLDGVFSRPINTELIIKEEKFYSIV